MPKDGKLTHGLRRSAIMRFFLDGYAMKLPATLLACTAAAIFACMPAAPAAATNLQWQWRAHCAGPAARFVITFDSPSGDITNDDMVATLKHAGKTSRIKLLKPQLYYSGRISNDAPSLCDTVTGMTLASGNILLLFRRDNRPGADHLAAILLDKRGQHVLDAGDDLGEVNTAPGVRQQDGKVEIQLIRKWAPLVKDQEDQPVDAWMRLSDEGNRIGKAWREAQ